MQSAEVTLEASDYIMVLIINAYVVGDCIQYITSTFYSNIYIWQNAALIGTGKDVDYKTAILFPVQGEYNVILNGQNTISGFYKVSTNASGAGNLKVTFSGDGQLAVSDCNFFINSWGRTCV